MHDVILGPGFPVLGSAWDSVMIYSFRTLFFLSAILLMVIVLLQEGKGGGLASALGGQGAETFGVSSGGVNKVTLTLAAVFLASALAHGLVFNRTVASRLGPKEPGKPAKTVEPPKDEGPPKKDETPPRDR